MSDDEPTFVPILDEIGQRAEASQRPKKHGGPRPGSGAPKGNLNALKHGLRSRQFAQVGALLARDPKIREALLALAERHNLTVNRSNEVAALLLTSLFDRAQQIADGRLNVDLPTGDWQAIKNTAAQASPAQHKRAGRNKKRPANNQDHHTARRKQPRGPTPDPPDPLTPDP